MKMTDYSDIYDSFYGSYDTILTNLETGKNDIKRFAKICEDARNQTPSEARYYNRVFQAKKAIRWMQYFVNDRKKLLSDIEKDLQRFEKRFSVIAKTPERGFIVEPLRIQLKLFQKYVQELQSKQTPAPAKLTFSTIAESFKEVSDWINIKNQLIENGYLSQAGRWIDFANGYKSTAAGFIKWLAVNGYCQVTNFEWQDVQRICINDFGFEEISKRTIATPPELPNKLSIQPKF